MKKLMPDLPGSLIECDSGLISDYDGVVVPIQDLTPISVFWMPDDTDPYIKARAYQNFCTELGKQIWQAVRETVNTAKKGEGARICVHWTAEAEVKPLPEELR